jgi:DNA invertase Pin-like site-specific DNA recombinase
MAKRTRNQQRSCKTAKTSKKQHRVIVYTRTSSKKSEVKLGVSRMRQEAAARSVVKSRKGSQRPTATVHETVSGCAPLAVRKKLAALLSSKPGTEIVVESARALARDAMLAEEVWRRAKQAGIHITCSDLPDLLKHNPNAAESLMRKVVFAVQEFDRDVLCARLEHGIAQKMKDEMEKANPRRSQQGHVKVNGRKSYLELTNTRDAALQRRIAKHCQDYVRKRVSSRALAKILSVLMRGKDGPVMSHETARRIATTSKK